MKKKKTKKSLSVRIWQSKEYYLLILPAIIYSIIFCYGPLYGAQIAFKNFYGSLGIFKSPWVGFQHFLDFFESYNFWTLIKNTFTLSVYSLLLSFPIPIVVALVLNELKSAKLKKFAQTILYAPHFISTVVLIGMVGILFSKSGIVNDVLAALGMERYYFMGEPGAFRHLYVWSGIWQNAGWNAIIYIAALSNVDPSLHESASLDGANRFQRIRYINLPCIMPTIVITLIMAIGGIASVGYEKVYLLQNELNVDVSEVISTYVYKRGIVHSNFSFSTAIGLFNNVINVSMLMIANTVSRRVSETSLF